MSEPIVKHPCPQSKSEEKIPTIAEVIADPSIHFRLKKWLAEALDADPVDAYLDADLLTKLLERRLTEKIGRWS
jgi:hypothetical protein